MESMGTNAEKCEPGGIRRGDVSEVRPEMLEAPKGCVGAERVLATIWKNSWT